MQLVTKEPRWALSRLDSNDKTLWQRCMIAVLQESKEQTGKGTDNLDGCDILLCGILIVEYIVDLCQNPNGMYNTKRGPTVN